MEINTINMVCYVLLADVNFPHTNNSASIKSLNDSLFS